VVPIQCLQPVRCSQYFPTRGKKEETIFTPVRTRSTTGVRVQQSGGLLSHLVSQDQRLMAQGQSENGNGGPSGRIAVGDSRASDSETSTSTVLKPVGTELTPRFSLREWPGSLVLWFSRPPFWGVAMLLVQPHLASHHVTNCLCQGRGRVVF
jgi:hypothetical protein